MTRADPIDPTGASSGHLPASLLERYASGAGPADAAWTVEAHLESCGACRKVLAAIVERSHPQVTALLRRVEGRLATEVARSTPMPAGRRRHLASHVAGWARSWTAPATLPRVLTTVFVVAAAVGLDLADSAASGRFPSLVLLLAPVAPLAGVSAAWSRGLDPAYEVVAASARAGLDLVLRRTLAVLAVVLPALAGAGGVVGVSPARWLLPCLGFTAGALALGEVVGLRRASRALAVVWMVGVAGPSLVQDRVPVVLAAAGRPAWLAVLLLAVALLVVRRRTYTWPAQSALRDVDGMTTIDGEHGRDGSGWRASWTSMRSLRAATPQRCRPSG